jgi:hypothetical protein
MVWVGSGYAAVALGAEHGAMTDRRGELDLQAQMRVDAVMEAVATAFYDENLPHGMDAQSWDPEREKFYLFLEVCVCVCALCGP